MWKDYLALSRKQQKGFIFMAFLLLLLILYRLSAPLFFPSSRIVVIKDDSLLIAFTSTTPVNKEPFLSDHIPAFNPNEVSIDFLVDIGVKEYIARNWTNYLARGGRFRKPSEVSRVYGMDSVLLAQLIPFMSIPPSAIGMHQSRFIGKAREPEREFVDLNRPDTALLIGLCWNKRMIDSLNTWLRDYWIPNRISRDQLKNWSEDSLLVFRNKLIPKKRKEHKPDLVSLEMNTADTSQWMLLPGIGPVLSKRIVAYRYKLGGYVSTDQLMEVYGVSPLLVNDLTPYLKVDTTNVRRININRASLRQLRNHPYIGFYKAQAILEARKSKGDFTHLSELLDLEPFKDVSWQKIQPYLKVE